MASPEPPTDPGSDPSPDWRARAGELAAHAWAHLVNRTDVWGAYIAPGRRPVRLRADGTASELRSFTAPPRARRGTEALTEAALARHFAGRCPGHLVGLHATAPDLTCRWGLVEVDRHADADDAGANLRAVLHWRAVLARLGLRPWLTDSDGRGGYHLRVVLDRPVPAGRMCRFLRRLVRDHARLGLARPPERFPRQPGLPPGGCGNWVRLPGRHHTREHWTRVWTGGRWAAGGEAVAALLAAAPAPADLLPDLPEATDPVPVATVPVLVPAPAAAGPAGGDGRRLTDREVALRCLAGIRNADLDFDQWLAVGMALHSADPGPAMLAAWEGWSATSGKHVPGECGRRWPSFAAAAAGGRAWRVGTLVHLARRDGHDPFPRRGPRADAPRRLVATSLSAPAPRPAGGPLSFTSARAGRGVA